MVLKALGLQEQHDLTSLARACGTKSIWTIDLAHLLARCGAAVSLLTVTIGANPSYAAEQFYAESITQDEARVAILFQASGLVGYSYMCMSTMRVGPSYCASQPRQMPCWYCAIYVAPAMLRY